MQNMCSVVDISEKPETLRFCKLEAQGMKGKNIPQTYRSIIEIQT